MGYFVRKYKDIVNRNLINDAASVDSVVADVLKEFQTCDNGDLSVWKIDNITEIKKAILPIAITNDCIREINVILIDESLVDSYNFDKANDSSGENLSEAIDSMHWNLKNISIGNIKNCVALYWDMMEKENHNYSLYNLRFLDTDIVDIILDAFKRGEISQDEIKCLKKLKRDYSQQISEKQVIFS